MMDRDRTDEKIVRWIGIGRRSMVVNFIVSAVFLPQARGRHVRSMQRRPTITGRPGGGKDVEVVEQNMQCAVRVNVCANFICEKDNSTTPEQTNKSKPKLHGREQDYGL